MNGTHFWAGPSSLICGHAAAALHRLDGFGLPNVIDVWTMRSLKRPNALVSLHSSAESGLEVRVIRLLRDEGYPPPIRQRVIDDEGNFVGRVDLVYPERRLILEVDSFAITVDVSHSSETANASML